MEVATKIKKIIQKIVEDAGYELDEVTYTISGNTGTLTVVIDKNGLIDVDDCVLVTNLINPILDENDPIKESYVLDVCSKEKGVE